MRRAAIAEIMEKRGTPPKRRVGSFPALPKTGEKKETVLNVQVLTAEQLSPELAELAPANVYVPIEILNTQPELIAPFTEAGVNIAAVLPRVMTDTEVPAVREMLQKLPDIGVKECLVGNLGHIALCRQCAMDVRGDFGLNTFNSHSIATLADAGLLSATASFELRMAQVRDLVKPIDTELIVYGRLPAMVSDQCIIKAANGSCSCEGGASMSDRMGSVFPVVREFGCRNVILNAHKLFLADKREDYLSAGLWAARLMFTTESARECAEILRAYQGRSEYRPNGLTRGLYYRGVE